MIIAYISDGLGNQMFQYAAARCLAAKRNAVLKVDLYHFNDNHFRRYGLGDFNIHLEKATWFDIFRLSPTEAIERILRRIRPFRLRTVLLYILHILIDKSPDRSRIEEVSTNPSLPPLRIGNVVFERFYHYDSDFFASPDNVYLYGFWQSERYFREIAPELRNEFRGNKPLDASCVDFARMISQTMSVSLHVRRGDKIAYAMHHVTSRAYCHAAIDFFGQRVVNPTFFVFSDDWEWVRHNLQESENVIFVEHATEGFVYEDLRMMSLCKHNIIAASTFSWWGAWLNPNPQKIVLYPGLRYWVNSPSFDAKDVFPADWIGMDTLAPNSMESLLPQPPLADV